MTDTALESSHQSSTQKRHKYTPFPHLIQIELIRNHIMQYSRCRDALALSCVNRVISGCMQNCPHVWRTLLQNYFQTDEEAVVAQMIAYDAYVREFASDAKHNMSMTRADEFIANRTESDGLVPEYAYLSNSAKMTPLMERCMIQMVTLIGTLEFYKEATEMVANVPLPQLHAASRHLHPKLRVYMKNCHFFVNDYDMHDLKMRWVLMDGFLLKTASQEVQQESIWMYLHSVRQCRSSTRFRGFVFLNEAPVVVRYEVIIGHTECTNCDEQRQELKECRVIVPNQEDAEYEAVVEENRELVDAIGDGLLLWCRHFNFEKL